MTAVNVRRLGDIYLSVDPKLLERLGDLVAQDADAVVDVFYAALRAHPDARPFLDEARIAAGLRRALAEWLRTLFQPRHSAAVYDFIRRQREIGKAHARLSIPMHLIAEGMRVIRQELRERLLRSDIAGDERTQALVVIGDVLDQSVSIMNAAYMGTTVAEERDVYSLRMRLAGSDLASHCEKLRSHLFRWLSQTIAGLYQRRSAYPGGFATLRQSEFGVWALHKAELLIPNHDEVARLREHLETIDRILERALACREEQRDEDLEIAVRDLGERVNDAAWIMGSLIEKTLEQESARDALTRIYNRRYLPTILKRETQLSLKFAKPYALLIFDIDHFKRINDQFGHDCGDAVLWQFAERLAQSSRASDYLFRFGGEEFLLIANEVNETDALKVANRARQMVAAREFRLREGLQRSITTSVGVAAHDGHPDYERTLARAEAALYHAKSDGRNRCVLASNVVEPAA